MVISVDIVGHKKITTPTNTCTFLDLVPRLSATPESIINITVKFFTRASWWCGKPKKVNLSARPVSADITAIRKMTMSMNMYHVAILDLVPEFALGNMKEKNPNRN